MEVALQSTALALAGPFEVARILQPLAWIGALLILSMAAAQAVGASGGDDEFQEVEEIETIDLIPEDQPSFGMRNVTARLASIFRGASHYYDVRVLSIETTPTGAYLDLFYVRSNFQKRFEQAESPVRVLLPPRAQTAGHDSLEIRAFAEGYRLRTVRLRADTSQTRAVIDLDPLPNTLESVSHQYFAGRTSLTFFTQEQLAFRVQEADDGISVILTETARSREASATLESARSPIVEEMLGEQLGEDLLVQLNYSRRAIENEVEVRSRESFDVARDLHAFTLELLLRNGRNGRNGRSDAVARAHAALSRLTAEDVDGCALEFDSGLRALLDRGALARALTPHGSFTDPYLRAAMRRLGEVSPRGVVSIDGGAVFDPSVPIELEAALSQAADAVGYLALLRGFVAEFEAEPYRSETLRSLVSPELEFERFENFVDVAVGQERACRASR
jgi:hypothetical protein